MRTHACLLIAAAALGLNSMAQAQTRPPGPLRCPTTPHGKSTGPYYGIEAHQYLRRAQPNLFVTGQYRLSANERRATLREQKPGGIVGSTLLVKVSTSRRGTHRFCAPLNASFHARRDQYNRVTITDPRGKSITVDVKAH